MNPESIAWKTNSLFDSSAVCVRWLGTAGVELTSGPYSMLVDPYVSRAPLTTVLTRKLRPNAQAIRAYTPRADGILVGHAHFDHVLDVPSIAKLTGAKVFGSSSTKALCEAQGVPQSQLALADATPAASEAEIGPFRIRFHRGEHSRLLFGWHVPAGGELSPKPEGRMRAHEYRCGQLLNPVIQVSGRTIIHLGSGELSTQVPEMEVDLAIVCVAGWHLSPMFPERLVRTVHPKAILLVHWDNFFAPFEAGVRTLPGMKFGELVDRLVEAAPSVQVGTLPYFGDVRI